LVGCLRTTTSSVVSLRSGFGSFESSWMMGVFIAGSLSTS
jgi:hypothetical protein